MPRLARKPCALSARLDKPAVAQAGVFPFMLSYIAFKGRSIGGCYLNNAFLLRVGLEGARWFLRGNIVRGKQKTSRSETCL